MRWALVSERSTYKANCSFIGKSHLFKVRFHIGEPLLYAAFDIPASLPNISDN
jgi:hypothetical protein